MAYGYDPQETYYDTCSECGNEFKTSQLTMVEGKLYCRTCLNDTETKTCPVCLNTKIYYDDEMCETCHQAELEDQAEKQEKLDRAELIKDSKQCAVGCLIVLAVVTAIYLLLLI